MKKKMREQEESTGGLKTTEAEETLETAQLEPWRSKV